MPPSVLPMATDMEEDGAGGGLAGAFQEEYEEEDEEEEEEEDEDEEEDDDEGMLDEDDGEGFDEEEDSQDMEVKHDSLQGGNYETEIDEICESYMNSTLATGSSFLLFAAFSQDESLVGNLWFEWYKYYIR